VLKSSLKEPHTRGSGCQRPAANAESKRKSRALSAGFSFVVHAATIQRLLHRSSGRPKEKSHGTVDELVSRRQLHGNNSEEIHGRLGRPG
jgi:hypothetical protein